MVGNYSSLIYRILLFGVVLLGIASCGEPFDETSEFLNATAPEKEDAVKYYLGKSGVDSSISEATLQFIIWGMTNATSRQALDATLDQSDFHKYMQDAVFVLYSVSASSTIKNITEEYEERISVYYSLLFESIMFSDVEICGLSTAILHTDLDIGILDLVDMSELDLAFSEEEYSEDTMYLLLMYAGERIFFNITVGDFLYTDIYGQAMLLRIIWLNSLIANNAFRDFSSSEIERYLESCQDDYIANRSQFLESPLIETLDNSESLATLATAVIDLISLYGELPTYPVDRIDVEGYPLDIACSGNGEYIYVASNGGGVSSSPGDGSLCIIRTSDNVVVKTIPNIYEGRAVCASNDGNYIYAATRNWSNQGIQGSVLVISTRSNNVVARIILGDYSVYPSKLCLDNTGRILYVTDSINGTVTAINTANNRVVEIIDVSGAYGICRSTSREELYVANLSEEKSVSVISTANNCVDRIIHLDIDNWPYSVFITPSDEHLYVTYGEGVAYVRISDGTIVDKSIDELTFADNMCISPSEEYLYTSDGRNDTLTILRLEDNKVMVKIYLRDDSFPKDVCILPSGSAAYVACFEGGYIAVLE